MSLVFLTYSGTFPWASVHKLTFPVYKHTLHIYSVRQEAKFSLSFVLLHPRYAHMVRFIMLVL